MDVAERCKQIGMNALHIKIRATGGNRTRTPGPGGQSALRALARAGMRIGRIGMFLGGIFFDWKEANLWSWWHGLSGVFVRKRGKRHECVIDRVTLILFVVFL